MLDQIAFDVSSSVILVVIIKYMSVSEPSGLSDTELSTCLISLHGGVKLGILNDDDNHLLCRVRQGGGMWFSKS